MSQVQSLPIYDPLTNVLRAGIATCVPYAIVLAYFFAAAYFMDHSEKWASFLLGGVVIYLASLCAALFLIVGFLSKCDTSSELRFSNHLRLVIYFWSIAFLVGLSVLTWATGGIFQSKFAWLFEVAIVITVQLTAFSNPDNLQSRWGAPISYASFVILLYSCMELWPDTNSFGWTNGAKFVNWVNAICAIVIIIAMQMTIEIVQRYNVRSHIYDRLK